MMFNHSSMISSKGAVYTETNLRTKHTVVNRNIKLCSLISSHLESASSSLPRLLCFRRRQHFLLLSSPILCWLRFSPPWNYATELCRASSPTTPARHPHRFHQPSYVPLPTVSAILTSLAASMRKTLQISWNRMKD